MKKIIFLSMFAALFILFACKKESENYSIYRPTHPQNFKTELGGELYAFTANDSAVERADYYLRVKGQVKTYGSKIVGYGHCWSSTNSNPYISNSNDTLFTDPVLEYGVLDTIGFITRMPNLEENTTYYIRSYVITEDENGVQTVGYNPVVTQISTVPAIDIWYERFASEKPTGFRFDAIAFNLGDTVFFGTGNQGNKNLMNDIQMYDPQLDTWDSEVLPTLPYTTTHPTNGTSGYGFTDGVGCAIVFQDINAPQGKYAKCIYVGFGDYGGEDNYYDKSDFFWQYDFETNVWKEMSESSGARRSGAVCFVIDERIYVGTGKTASYQSTFDVYFPAKDRDGDDETQPWRSLQSAFPGVGRVGAVAFTINGRAYVGLGRDESGNFLNDFYEFRPSLKTENEGAWERKEDFPGIPRANAVSFVIGDQGYVGTGDNITGDMEAGPYPYDGEIFNDFYRYDPYNDRWTEVKKYTANKIDRVDAVRPITRAVGWSLPSKKLGYAGFGIVPVDYPIPDEPTDVSSHNGQKDVWTYQPYDPSAK